MKTCTKCQQAKPVSEFYKNARYADGYLSWCKACHREYYRRPEQKKKGNALVKAWTEKNKEHVSKYAQEYYKENKTEYRKREQELWHSNPAYREKKNKRHKERRDERKKTEPGFIEKVAGWITAGNHRRRARNLSVADQGHYTASEFEALCEKFNHRCLCCGEKKPLTVDHVVPLSLGGTNLIENVQPLCGSCNTKKFTKSTDYRSNPHPKCGSK